MADDDDDMFSTELDDDQNTKPKESGGGLRKQLEAALAELKTEREKRTELEAKDKQYTIDKVFGELEVPEKVRKFYSGEPDKDKILNWVKDNADVFGITLSEGEPDGDKDRNDQLRNVSQANQVGFEGNNNAAETVARTAMAGIKSGKITEAELDEQLARMFR